MLYKTENPHGGDIYEGNIELDFSANTNPFGTPDSVKAAVSARLGDLSHYPDPYCRKLVSAVAVHENVPESYVLCGAGAAELIYSYAAAEKPKSIVEPAPTFAEYSLPLSTARISRFLLKEENGFRVTEGLLDHIAAADPDTVFLCNPNNPTGRLAATGLIEKVAQKCKSVGAQLFLDECFMDLSDGGQSFVPRLKEYPNVVVLKAFTKSYGMAGLRLGYCLSANEALLTAMSRSVQPWNVSTAAQAAGIAALGEAGFLEKTLAFVKRERPRLAGGLRDLGFSVFDSDTIFLLFKGAAGLDIKLLAKGIKIRNCANFPGLGEGFYRVPVKLPEENSRLLDSIRECL